MADPVQEAARRAAGAMPATAPGAVQGCPADAAPTGLWGDGGKEVYKDDKLEVKTGIVLKSGEADTKYKDMIAIKVKCATNPHVVQFVYREILDKDGKPKAKRIKTSGGEYDTTTDPKNPNWNTDSVEPDPYYDQTSASRSDPGELTIFDEPAMEWPTGALKLEEGETSRATFKSYVICAGKVIREVTWVRSAKKGEKPAYSVAAQKADAMPEWANKQLKAQGYDPAP